MTQQYPHLLQSAIAGAIFDFAGYLTTRPDVLKVGSTEPCPPLVELIQEWSDLRGLSLHEANVTNWHLLLGGSLAPVSLDG